MLHQTGNDLNVQFTPVKDGVSWQRPGSQPLDVGHQIGNTDGEEPVLEHRQQVAVGKVIRVAGSAALPFGPVHQRTDDQQRAMIIITTQAAQQHFCPSLPAVRHRQHEVVLFLVNGRGVEHCPQHRPLLADQIGRIPDAQLWHRPCRELFGISVCLALSVLFLRAQGAGFVDDDQPSIGN